MALNDEPSAANNLTIDAFFNGNVQIYQPAKGYRFSIDAVLLAATPHPKPGDIIMDIGTGCGVIPILMAYKHPKIRAFGIEMQPDLAKIAEKNVGANQMQNRITIINQDIRLLKSKMTHGPVDWVVSNPPYRPANSGRVNPHPERASARHEINLNLKELMQTTKRFLRTGGRFVIVYPSERLVDLFYEMRLAGIEPKWIQNVHSRMDESAKLVLVQGMMRGNPGLKILAPLVIYGVDGNYTDVVKEMMGPS